MRPRLAILLVTIFLLFALIVVGAYVAAGNFGGACGSNVPADWPWCRGGPLPPPQLGPMVEYSHRLLAALSTLFLFVTTYLYWRNKDSPDATPKFLLAASLLLVLQVLLGGAVVAAVEPPSLVALHQALAVLIFGLAVGALARDVR